MCRLSFGTSFCRIENASWNSCAALSSSPISFDSCAALYVERASSFLYLGRPLNTLRAWLINFLIMVSVQHVFIGVGMAYCASEKSLKRRLSSANL
jgi:hypothetical protein